MFFSVFIYICCNCVFFIILYFFLSCCPRWNWLLSLQEAKHSCCCLKILKIRAIPILFATGFNSGAIFVILYSFLMLILCDQLFILITTVHCCFLSNENLPGYWRFFCPCLASLLFICLRDMLRVIRTVNIFVHVVIRKILHHTIIFLEIWILGIS